MIKIKNPHVSIAIGHASQEQGLTAKVSGDFRSQRHTMHAAAAARSTDISTDAEDVITSN